MDDKMNAKRNVRNILVFGAIAILLGSTFLPIVNPNLSNTETIGKESLMKSDISLELEEEKEEVTCRFYEPTGMETTTRKILKKEMEELDSILQNGDSKEIALQLENLHLFPETMNVKEAEKLIAGRCHPPLSKKIEPVAGGRKVNLFCFIHMEGEWEQINPFIELLWYKLLEHKEDFPLLFSLLNLLIKFYLWNENNVPVKLAHLLIHCFGWEWDSIITTIGLNGIWSARGHGRYPTSVIIVGFTGIWIQWKGYDWVNGFALFVL